jgi:hypothetical protein
LRPRSVENVECVEEVRVWNRGMISSCLDHQPGTQMVLLTAWRIGR